MKSPVRVNLSFWIEREHLPDGEMLHAGLDAAIRAILGENEEYEGARWHAEWAKPGRRKLIGVGGGMRRGVKRKRPS